jgi:predicted secreted protein
VDASKAGQQSVTITEGQNGQTFHLRVGDEVVVTLAAAPGLGNFWQLAPLNSPVAVLAGTERAAIPPAMPGGAVNHLFRLQIKSAGTVALHFNLLSVRMPGTKLSTFTVTLQAE